MNRFLLLFSLLVMGLLVMGLLVMGAGCRTGLERIRDAAPQETPSDASTPEQDAAPPDVDAAAETQLASRTVDGVMYQVRRGFVLDAPFGLSEQQKARFADRFQTLALPSSGSAYPAGVYLGLKEPSEIVYLSDGDENERVLATMHPRRLLMHFAFTDATSDFGDQLFGTFRSSLANERGIFRIGQDGSLDQFAELFLGADLFLDTHGLLATGVSAGRLYLLMETDPRRIRRFRSDGSSQQATMDIDPVISGFYAADRGFFADRLWIAANGSHELAIFSSEARETTQQVLNGRQVWVTPSSIHGRHSIAFGNDGPFGDFLYLRDRNEGRIVRYDADGTLSVVLTGVSGITGIAMDGAGEALWVMEHARGQILRLRRE